MSIHHPLPSNTTQTPPTTTPQLHPKSLLWVGEAMQEEVSTHKEKHVLFRKRVLNVGRARTQPGPPKRPERVRLHRESNFKRQQRAIQRGIDSVVVAPVLVVDNGSHDGDGFGLPSTNGTL